jgi:hypothetical protein
MKTGVRIIKGGRASVATSLPVGRDEKTVRQSEREIASTIKGWVAESARRRRDDEQSAAQLVAALHRAAIHPPSSQRQSQ